MDSPESSDLLRTRVSLLHRLKDPTDADSWGEFFQRYQKVVRNIAQRRGLTDHDAEEVVMEVFTRVSNTIQSFDAGGHPGSFRTWLFRLTKWRASDKLSRHQTWSSRSESIDNHPNQATPNGSPADELEREARHDLLEVLFHRLEKTCSQKQLQIFRMLVIDEMPVEKVCKLFRIHKNTAYVIRHRLTLRLKEEAAKLPLGNT